MQSAGGVCPIGIVVANQEKIFTLFENEIGDLHDGGLIGMEGEFPGVVKVKLVLRGGVVVGGKAVPQFGQMNGPTCSPAISNLSNVLLLPFFSIPSSYSARGSLHLDFAFGLEFGSLELALKDRVLNPIDFFCFFAVCMAPSSLGTACLNAAERKKNPLPP